MAAHSQPHQIINHVSNTYSCKSQIHEWREVSSSILNNMAQHRHRMPNTDKNHVRDCSHHPPHQVEEPVFNANNQTAKSSTITARASQTIQS
jgi:hypothetical protein